MWWAVGVIEEAGLGYDETVHSVKASQWVETHWMDVSVDSLAFQGSEL
jgi:hypothetical protein